MKKKIIGLIVIFAVCFVAGLVAGLATSCSKTVELNYVGLNAQYEVVTDEKDIVSYGVSGIGSVTESAVEIPQTYKNKPVSAIMENAFKDNTRIERIDIKDNIKYIGKLAFAGCSNMVSTNLSGTFEEGIDEDAFAECTGIERVNYKGDLSTWCGIIFATYTSNPLSNIADLYINDTLIENLVIPNGVTRIEGGVFCGCSSIKSLTMGTDVAVIGDEAFSDCINLASVTLGSNVNEIGMATFYGCTSLESITIPNGVTKIDNWTFTFSGLKDVTLGNNVDEICEQAFAFTPMSHINLPTTVTTIGKAAFVCCENLTSITLGGDLETIEDDAFYRTSLNTAFYQGDIGNVQNITIGSNNYKLENSTTLVYSEYAASGAYWHFDIDNKTPLIWGTNGIGYTATADGQGYIAAKGVLDSGAAIIQAVHEGLPVVGIAADGFKNCGITSVYLPNSIKEIGANAFEGCTSLESITIPDSVTTVGASTFVGCTSLVSVNISRSMGELVENMFSGCTSLKSVDIGSGVQTIKATDFTSCTALESLVIGIGLSEIETNALTPCTALSNIYFLGTASDWAGISSVSGVHSSVTVSYYANEQPTDTTSSYWHYVDGVPTVWTVKVAE